MASAGTSALVVGITPRPCFESEKFESEKFESEKFEKFAQQQCICLQYVNNPSFVTHSLLVITHERNGLKRSELSPPSSHLTPASLLASQSCHPANAYLTLENGQSIAIERAEVGTLVKTDTGFQPILGFLHAEEETMVWYLRLTTPSASMTISPLHHAFVNGTEIDPFFIKLGDLLHTPHGLEPVTRIETVEARGAYHIYVKGGNYYVDGILASDYIPLVLQHISPHGPFGFAPRAVTSFVHAYVEARY